MKPKISEARDTTTAAYWTIMFFNLLEYSNSENRSYTNCPKYKVKNYYIRSESGKKFESSNENFEKYIDLWELLTYRLRLSIFYFLAY